MAAVRFRSTTKAFEDSVAVADLDLEIADGELLVLAGPSGCGKSTVLRMIAGLETPTSGDVEIGDDCVTDMAPRDRDVAMVFQNYALYPHMSVERNLGFALRRARVRREVITERVESTAHLLELVERLDKKPGQLSGGQNQRVAMGRAIVREPKVFLMDEPLSNLDARLRATMRAEIVALQQQLGTTMVYVTHDQVEALTMGDRVAVLRGGVLQQVAPPDELFCAPRNTFVAGFIGTPPMNLYRSTLTRTAGGGVSLDLGGTVFDYSPPEVAGSGLDEVCDGEVIVGIRPHDIVTGRGTTATASVALVELLGAELIVHAVLEATPFVPSEGHGEAAATPGGSAAGAPLVARLVAGKGQPQPGDLLGVEFPARALHLFDPDTEERTSGPVLPRGA